MRPAYLLIVFMEMELQEVVSFFCSLCFPSPWSIQFLQPLWQFELWLCALDKPAYNDVTLQTGVLLQTSLSTTPIEIAQRHAAITAHPVDRLACWTVDPAHNTISSVCAPLSIDRRAVLSFDTSQRLTITSILCALTGDLPLVFEHTGSQGSRNKNNSLLYADILLIVRAASERIPGLVVMIPALQVHNTHTCEGTHVAGEPKLGQPCCFKAQYALLLLVVFIIWGVKLKHAR